MQRLFTIAGIAALALSVASAAHADAVMLTGTSLGADVQTQLYSKSGQLLDQSSWAGPLTLTVGTGASKQTITTFCVEYDAFIYMGQQYTDYKVAPVGSAHGFTAAQDLDLRRLFTLAGVIDTDVKAAAAQLATWEIMQDSGLDLGAGRFTASRSTSRTASEGDLALAQASTWLDELGTVSVTDVQLTKYYSPTGQDQMQVTLLQNVPEPGSLSLAGAALAAALGVRRRQRK
ncbi:PEP-CTERM sorting domain-containing protein [Paucibacter sp. R3-3]|uniref:PEP-CTERM sorting domain-containing protein n=1 Tax=Roseateles agri TaxID=3098619 RepID=A0ABU5DLF3_9BURK|nr:PEP-CTERM sorting domain-containing protein [Paucibacter sp. R3-3]MDY0747140.1 PEP-CTERM sorting domain-containing protein [Paucibacter sp. R3-3]